jgi:hypothetical protein
MRIIQHYCLILSAVIAAAKALAQASPGRRLVMLLLLTAATLTARM